MQEYKDIRWILAALFVVGACEGLKEDIRTLCEDPVTIQGQKVCDRHVVKGASDAKE